MLAEKEKKKKFLKRLDKYKKISTFAIPNRTGVHERSSGLNKKIERMWFSQLMAGQERPG